MKDSEISHIVNKISKDLELFLNKYSPNEFRNIFKYAIFPTGKLIRPLLANITFASYSKDGLSEKNQNDLEKNLKYFSNFLEIHHNYTLLHDDLPCMDDDKYRRGKICTHIKYSEWEALLSGDAMLGMSYQSLSMIDHPLKELLVKISHYCLGPKGLILGQYYDLKKFSSKNISLVLETHKLKTARLFQLSLIGGFFLAQKNKSSRNFSSNAKLIWRIGENIGITFQLLDDLFELFEEDIKSKEHELLINPFITFTKESFYQLKIYKTKLELNLSMLESNKLKIYLLNWIEKSFSKISSLEKKLLDHQSYLINYVDINHFKIELDKLNKSL